MASGVGSKLVDVVAGVLPVIVPVLLSIWAMAFVMQKFLGAGMSGGGYEPSGPMQYDEHGDAICSTRHCHYGVERGEGRYCYECTSYNEEGSYY